MYNYSYRFFLPIWMDNCIALIAVVRNDTSVQPCILLFALYIVKHNAIPVNGMFVGAIYRKTLILDAP